jgi:hypothetical protein
MIVYNVTVKIDLDINDVWLPWMKSEHIPKVIATGCFSSYKMYRVVEADQTDGITYAIQYFGESMSDYFTYQNEYAKDLQKEVKDLFPDKFVAFRTVLREV